MISDGEIWACANLVIKQHGDGAKLHSAGQADHLLEQGDMEGKRVWCQILEQIGELWRVGPRGGEAPHYPTRPPEETFERIKKGQTRLILAIS